MAKGVVLLLGVVLLAVGMCGALTGGHNHDLIIFGINMTHNVVHMLSGAVALLAATGGEKHAKTSCLLFGLVYGLVAISGLLNLAAVVDLLNLNMADNILHLTIAAVCFYAGTQSKPA